MGLYDDLHEYLGEAADLDDDYHVPLEFTVTAEAGAPEIEATYSLNDPNLDKLTHMPPPPGSGEEPEKPVDIEKTVTPPAELAARLRDALDTLHGTLAVPQPATVEHPRLECDDGSVTGVATVVHEVSGGGLHPTLVSALTAQRDDIRASDVTEVIVRFDMENPFKLRFLTNEPVAYSPSTESMEEFCEFRATWPDEERTVGQLLDAEEYEVVTWVDATEAAENAVSGALDARMLNLLSLPEDVELTPRRIETSDECERIKARVEVPIED